MNDDNKRKVYGTISSGRLLDIKVILDGEEVYNGMVEDAPEHIRQLKYSKVDVGSQMTYYVYSELNQ